MAEKVKEKKEEKEEKIKEPQAEAPKEEVLPTEDEEAPLDKKGRDKFSILVITGAFFLLAFFMGGLGYYIGSMRNPQPQASVPAEQTAVTPTPKPQKTNEDWQKTQLFGLSFEYPTNWQAVGNYGDNAPDEIFLSDTPITLNLPGDKPVAPISATIESGLKNPQAKFDSDKKNLNKGMEEPKVSEVQKDRIIHFSAKFTATDPNSGQVQEGYLIYLTAKDDRNTKIVKISSINHEDLSDTLKHITTSFKNQE